MLLSDLPDEVYERVWRLLGGHCLRAACTCKMAARAYRGLKSESDRVPFPNYGDIWLFCANEVGAVGAFLPQRMLWSEWAALAGMSLPTAFVTTGGENVLRRGGHPGACPRNAWSRIRCLTELPLDSSFSFELKLDACGGRETKICLLDDELILRKGNYHHEDGMWCWCCWDGSWFVDKRPVTAIEDGCWHTITLLMHDAGVTLIQDGHVLRDYATQNRIPTFHVQHLDVHTPLEVQMRNPRVILPEGSELRKTGEFPAEGHFNSDDEEECWSDSDGDANDWPDGDDDDEPVGEGE